ncbi:GAF domain-containing protein [Chitinophaga rhizophila]|uniref:GAF domain-containing protein n=1 Tax=Chitinophaga rhizophila TaxID=2866212 RepID=A0ABS7GMV2_9BACT|nr:GAF domain-containing protein [Chitinophaga rhizophila]MBW8688048.1 GAF domain-containing protein [Chitinophaga rhizophila]
MQKRNFDSTFCGSVPLHQINLIQPYGMLLVVRQADYRIVQVSENITAAIGKQPVDIVETMLSDYIPETQMKELHRKLEEGLVNKLPFTLSFTGDQGTKDYLAIAHLSAEAMILEIEELGDAGEDHSFIDIYQQLKYAMAAINATRSIKAACETAAKQLKELSGFDKVMVYKFDQDWNGTVLAEEQEEGMESYLGLTFPASDIPRQARAMYLDNPYRMIPNREYVPVSLYPVINPLTNAFTDLSGCNLRSVPAVHLEYMKNMAIMTSMSCRILKDGQLWGLFSCHHRTAYRLPYEGRALFELLSDIIAAHIQSLSYKEQSDEYTKLHDIHTRLIEQVFTTGELGNGLLEKEASVLQLLNASGAALLFNRRLDTIGKVPGKNELKDLFLWLQSTASSQVFQELHLAGSYEPAIHYADIASGILVIPVQPSKGEFLVVFRPEVVQEVNWGGNPNEAIRFEKDNIQYHPRNSFSIWQQTVRNTALPWKDTEIQMAGLLRNFLLEFLIKGLD